ncbi:major facilitator superfamily domain-containing protein [Zychaea mexicana]|uniref:major facilitator superfamily domain-containing protein n=1 Tax=Zychaea mexicana TaxID=64656 RepID=UPI0022FE89C5|nr:major facilitator superfamily domain-containing protein [Zychaea mexicana]KAI9495936.1 major facilitator superfamily domain-containing protein [Zychaea mexicana]
MTSPTSNEDNTSETVVHDSGSHNEDKEQKKRGWIKYLIGDPYASDDPQQLSMRHKQIIIFIVALSGISGPLASMIYMPGLLSVARDLDTSMEAVNGTVSAYVVFMGIAPLFWAVLSDYYGRKRMYLLSIIIGIIASIICAVSTNVAMLIVFRAIQAGGSCASQTLGAGVIADTIPVAQRGRAYGFFYIGPLVGPVIGPTVGGVLCQYLGWQSTFYFTAILGGVLLVLVAVFLPETLRKKHPKGNSNPTHSAVKEMLTVFGPMFSMLRDPSVLLITIYSTVIFACLYFLNPTITDTFQSLYGYNEWQVGLCYLAFGVGLMMGSVIAGQVSDFVLQYLRKQTGGKVIPEMRLRAAIPSFILIPAGYFIYGWTTEYGIGVYAPILGLFIYAFGQMSAFTPATVYLVDSQPGRSATAVGVNNCSRSVVAAIMAIFSTEALHTLGTGILFSILAALNIVNIVFVVMCMISGQRWREAHAEKVKARQGIDGEDDNDNDAFQDKKQHESLQHQDEEQREGEIQHALARTASRHSAI